MFHTPVFQRSCIKVLFKLLPVTELKPIDEIIVTGRTFSNINILLMMIMKALVLSRDSEWSFKKTVSKFLLNFTGFAVMLFTNDV